MVLVIRSGLNTVAFSVHSVCKMRPTGDQALRYTLAEVFTNEAFRYGPRQYTLVAPRRRLDLLLLGSVHFMLGVLNPPQLLASYFDWIGSLSDTKERCRSLMLKGQLKVCSDRKTVLL